MEDYEAFARAEREGWADPDTVEAWERRFGALSDQAARAIFEAVGTMAAPGRTALDLCCGHGALTAALTSSGARTVGLDFSEAMLARAARLAPDAELRRGDAAALPFPDSSFDLVVSNFGLPHVPDRAAALGEVARVLKRRGLFAMTCWLGPEASPAQGALFRAVAAHGAPEAAPPPAPDFYALSREDEAGAALARAGLRLERLDEVPLAFELNAPSQLHDIFATATVSARAMLSRQPPEAAEAIRAAMADEIGRERRFGDRWRVPCPAALLVARPA